MAESALATRDQGEFAAEAAVETSASRVARGDAEAPIALTARTRTRRRIEYGEGCLPSVDRRVFVGRGSLSML